MVEPIKVYTQWLNRRSSIGTIKQWPTSWEATRGDRGKLPQSILDSFSFSSNESRYLYWVTASHSWYQRELKFHPRTSQRQCLGVQAIFWSWRIQAQQPSADPRGVQARGQRLATLGNLWDRYQSLFQKLSDNISSEQKWQRRQPLITPWPHSIRFLSKSRWSLRDWN